MQFGGCDEANACEPLSPTAVLFCIMILDFASRLLHLQKQTAGCRDPVDRRIFPNGRYHLGVLHIRPWTRTVVIRKLWSLRSHQTVRVLNAAVLKPNATIVARRRLTGLKDPQGNRIKRFEAKS